MSSDLVSIKDVYKGATPETQKPWVGLTQIDVDSWDLPDRPTVFEFAQFIEAKLKERNYE